ncbi:putative nicotine oxidoreductase [Dermacentor andersoni]|uniref:putative nicotine oxidoreductase n=1 Tax=Dermacentor andersoni TaxID=34620 RepID=UPI003B3B1D5B
MEHAVLARLTNDLEDRDMLPHTMLWFRRGLSTQDAMFQLKHHIVDNPTQSIKSILALDLKKALDNVKHAAILESIRTLGQGERMYDYIPDFLTGRRARIAIGGLEPQDIGIGCTGTPQGSMISPMLFNLVLLGLSRKLAQIEGLHHSFSADDITLWVFKKNDSDEQSLQAAVDAV